ncbi:flagellar hook-basal body complex protein, partial [bacterium]|nr:flagellar hook-basal body complex protein [bacterium]
MLRSVYSGITGMRINQMWFDVIAENMANVNTSGFKKSRINFEDLLNQTFEGATQARGDIGGTNAMQVGLGGAVATIQTIHTQGAVKETQISTDLMINGDGYFVVAGAGNTNTYTRAGNFGFDAQGNLINLSNGFKVLGWNAERNSTTGQLAMDADNKTKINTDNPLTGIKILDKDRMSPKSTTKLSLSDNLNEGTKIAFDQADLNLVKYISSVVPVSRGGGGIIIGESWANAGFENVPTGTITIGPKGNTQTLILGSKPQDLITDINQNSATTGITIEYTDTDKFLLKTDPTNTRIQEAGGVIIVSETPATGRTGFFTEAKIPTGEYNSSIDMKIGFEHILDPSDPNNIYFRWKAVNPTTDKVISTNAYYYKEADYGIAAKQVTGELLGYGTDAIMHFELDSADVDPTSLQVYVEDPISHIKSPYTPYRLYDTSMLGPQPGYVATDADAYYYFDDNGQMEYYYDPITPFNRIDIGKSSDGKDRIIIFKRETYTGLPPVPTDPPTFEYGAPRSGTKITADYSRNGFNISQSTVDPTTLEMKINSATVDKTAYRFNNNLGEGGVDQVTFYSTASEEEVVRDTLDISQPFNKAGFNTALSLVMSIDALSSTITVNWGGGKTFTSGKLSGYGSVGAFLNAVQEGVNTIEGEGSDILGFYYDPTEDKFKIENKAGINISQSHAEGFLTHAKLLGEGVTTAVSISANINPESREEVVTNRLDLTKHFQKAGFNNGFPDADPVTPDDSSLIFSWVTQLGSTSWISNALGSYTSVNEFIDHVNVAVSATTGEALPITLRYDTETDRFTITNTGSNVTVSQTTRDGFLTKAKLLTEELLAVSVPVSPPYSSGDVVAADYNYNKTVNAKGILQMNNDYKVINNFMDTESVPEILSSREVINGSGAVNLAGNWNQFDSGTVNGTISIKTDSGSFESKEINLSNYLTVQALLTEINASEAKVSIEYDSTTDKFKVRSKSEGARITLSENGSTPFFSEINISLGTIEGGNNNSVMDIEREKPTPEAGWVDTTKAAGTGRDFFRVNVVSNEVKAEKLGTTGSGKEGTQEVQFDISGLFPTGTADAQQGQCVLFGTRYELDTVTDNIWSLYLAHGDVDGDTVRVWRETALGVVDMVPNSIIEFQENKGPGGEDMIIIRAG